MTSTTFDQLEKAELPLQEKGAIGLLFSHFRRRWAMYSWGVFGMLLCNVTEVFIPKVIQWIIDLVSDGRIPSFLSTYGPADAARALVVIIAVTLIFQWYGRRVWRATLGRETHYVAASLKTRLWNSIRFYPQSRIEDDLNLGQLMTAATADVGVSRTLYGWTLLGVFDSLFLGVFSLALMLSTDAWLTLYVLAVFPFLPFLSHHTARLGGQRYRKAQDFLSSFNELASQAVTTQKLQRLSQSGALWSRRLVESAESYRGMRLRVRFTFLRFALLYGLPMIFCYGALFYWGSIRVAGGTLTIGEFVAFQSYVFILQGPLNELGYIIAEWQRGKASLNRLSDYFHQAPDTDLYPKATPSDPNFERSGTLVQVKGLKFRYPGSETELIDDLSFELEAGQRLGIRGEVGSGKSTLARIIAGMERRFRGELRVLGLDPREFQSPKLRSEIGFIEQKPFIFGDTIRVNLALDGEYSNEELWEVLELVALADDFRKLDKGLDTPLGEWGVNLSGGQKQRLTIARALLRRPSILILDDCLSAVDTVTEEHILKGLDSYLKGVTLIWIAHRESTLRYCDKVLELS